MLFLDPSGSLAKGSYRLLRSLLDSYSISNSSFSLHHDVDICRTQDPLDLVCVVRYGTLSAFAFAFFPKACRKGMNRKSICLLICTGLPFGLVRWLLFVLRSALEFVASCEMEWNDVLGPLGTDLLCPSDTINAYLQARPVYDHHSFLQTR